MPVSPLAGIARPSARAPAESSVKQREAHRLLQLGIAVELDVAGRPEVVEVGALLGDEPHPSRPCAPP